MLAEALVAEKAPVAPYSFRGGWTALFGNWGKAQRASARMATAAVVALVLIGAVGVGSIYASQDASPGALLSPGTACAIKLHLQTIVLLFSAQELLFGSSMALVA